jgi:hypothetical protein
LIACSIFIAGFYGTNPQIASPEIIEQSGDSDDE